MKLSNNFKLFITVVAVMLVFSLVFGGETRIVPIDDSYVYSKITEPGVWEDVNFDQDSYGLRIRSGSSTHWRRALLKFDISTIDADVVDSVQLKMTIQKIVNYSPTDGVCWIYKVEDNSWTEEAVTWNNQPARGVSIAFQDSLPSMSDDDPDTTLYFDVSEYVLEMLGVGNDQISFMLDDSTETGQDDGYGIDVRYYSKEKPNPELGADSASVYPMLIVYTSTSIGVADAWDGLPAGFSLRQNYPNPFNPTTSISYAIPRESLVEMIIYNVLGVEVKTLVQENHTAGSYTVIWDGADNQGNASPAGLYFCNLVAGNYQKTIKMAFVK